MHVKMPNTHVITLRIDIFQLTLAGFSIVLHIHVPIHIWNLNLSIFFESIAQILLFLKYLYAIKVRTFPFEHFCVVKPPYMYLTRISLAYHFGT